MRLLLSWLRLIIKSILPGPPEPLPESQAEKSRRLNRKANSMGLTCILSLFVMFVVSLGIGESREALNRLKEMQQETTKINQEKSQSISLVERIRTYEKYKEINSEISKQKLLNSILVILAFLGLICFIIGAGAVMERKGRSPWLGLLVLVPCLGLLIYVVLYFIPNKPQLNDYLLKYKEEI